MEWSLTMHLDVIVIVIVVGIGNGNGTVIDEQIVRGIGMIDEEAGIGMRGMRGEDLGRGVQMSGIGIARGTTGIGIGGEVVVEVSGNERGIIEIGGDRRSRRDQMGSGEEVVTINFQGGFALQT